MGSQAKVILPPTCPELFDHLLADGTFERHHGTNSLQNLTPAHQVLLKYSFQALKIGRPLNKCLVVMFGKTGSGKSTTINRLFEDEHLCPTHSSTSETKMVKKYSKRLLVNAVTPAMEGYISFLDVPGTLDVEHKNEASNFARVKAYREEDEGLTTRHFRSIPTAFRRIVRVRVYPNLVLLVAPAYDPRIMGTDSEFQKTLKSLALLDLVDRENLNLIVVMTSAYRLPRRSYLNKSRQITGWIQDCVYNVLRIKNVPVIFVENMPEDFDAPKREGSDFHELPNGELSHFNLMCAMKELFEKTGDRLGALFCGWYFNSTCPDRRNEVITHTPVYSEHPEYLQDVTSKLSNLGLIPTEDEDGNIVTPETPMYYFSTLGHGYCPVTETVKHQNLLKGSDLKEFQIEGQTYLIPSYFNPSSNGAETSCERLTFENKDAYQHHKSAQYGLKCGLNLIVQAAPEGRWMDDTRESNRSGLVSIRRQTKLISFSMKNPQQAITATFSNILNNLPKSLEEGNVHEFYDFFSRYGTHLVVTQSLGGEILYDCKVNVEKFTENKGRQIQNRIGGLLQNAVDGNVDAARDVSEAKSLGISEEVLRIRGGKPPVDPIERMADVNPDQLREWQLSIPESVVELEDGFVLVPFHDIMSQGSGAKALKQATNAYLENKLPRKEIMRRNALARQIVKDVTTTEVDWVFISTIAAGVLVALGFIAKLLSK